MGDVAALVQRLAGQTVRAALVRGAEIIANDYPEDGNGDARRLLVHALQSDVLALVTGPERILAEAEARRYAECLVRRSAGEPVSRIIGWRGFYGREFRITPATLDPRPETETLVDVVLKIAERRWPRGLGLELIDIGTGSGCLIVTLLAELPEARGVGVDISGEALTIAAENAERVGVVARCRWVKGRTFASTGRTFSLIVSNPPYIETGDIAGLARDVRQFDPLCALDGGVDGLDIYREIARGLPAHAAPGWVVLEAGDGQAADIAALCVTALPGRVGLCDVHLDMAGKARCVAIEVLN